MFGAAMKILTADPSPMLRAVLTAAFDTVDDVEVAASAGSAAELLVHCRRCRPQVVVSGLGFPDGELIEVIAEILRGVARVLVVCDAAAAEKAGALLLAGASGCLYVDDCGRADVVAAVRRVAAGDAALHPAAAATVLRMWRAERSREGRRADGGRPVPMPTLTPREDEVLRALARGLPTKSIGRELAVSPKTVEAHIARVLTKLGARNRAQAVALAESCGLLTSANGVGSMRDEDAR
jgi:DNA-binding NarL/FixJ family response regulator